MHALKEFIAEKLKLDIRLITDVHLAADPGFDCDTCGYGFSCEVFYTYNDIEKRCYSMDTIDTASFLNGLNA